MPLLKYIQGLVVAMLCMGSTSVYAIVKLSGNIQHSKSDSIKVSYSDNKLAYYPKDYYAILDKNGNFSMEFPVPDGIYIQAEIKHGSHLTEVMLYDGDSLKLTIDAAKFDSTVRYTGRGSVIQNFVSRHALEKGRLNQYSVRLRDMLTKEPADFLKSIEKEKNDELAYLDKSKSKLPAPFVKFWAAHYTYYNYFFTEQYPRMHQSMKVKRYTDTIPPELFVVLKELPNAFDDELMQVPAYLLYLTGIFEVRLQAAGYCFPVTDTIKARKLLDSINILGYKQLPGKSGEYFIAQSLYPRIKIQQIERTREQITTFKKRWPNSEYTLLLDKQVTLAEMLLPGQPAPDIDLTDADGKQIKLSDLRGKVVYLGFWARWCKECVGEMIAERKVKDILKNKPVAFAYVSIDDDTTGMARLLKHYNIDGFFAWTKGGWYAKEIGLYGVQGMPAYFLIDREGKFAVQNPPTPQQTTELIVAISKLY